MPEAQVVQETRAALPMPRFDQIRATPEAAEDVRREARSINLKLDANESMLLARQLEYLKARLLVTQFDTMKALRFIPIDSSIPVGAAEVSYEMLTETGAAKVVSDAADDVPFADAYTTRFTSGIAMIAMGYKISLRELQAAAYSGRPIDAIRATSARGKIDRKIDEIASLGSLAENIAGFVNNANITPNAPTNGAWASKTPQEMLADLIDFRTGITSATRDAFGEDGLSLLVAPAVDNILDSTFMGTNSEMTVKKWILTQLPWLASIDRWQRLATAGAGNATRAILYPKREDVVRFNLPLPFAQLPPQAKNFAFVNLMYAYVGTVELPQPLAVAYMDGL